MIVKERDRELFEEIMPMPIRSKVLAAILVFVNHPSVYPNNKIMNSGETETLRDNIEYIKI